MSSEFTFGDNSDEFYIFRFFFLKKNWLTVTSRCISDTDVVTTARVTGADKGNQTVESPSQANMKTLRFNVASIHGSGELACTTHRSDELYLQDDVGKDWQNWRTSIHSQCVSCHMKLNAGIRRMNLDVSIRRMLIFPFHRLWKRSQRREIP